MKYLLGTDIGTSGTKTILMNTEGKLISQDLEEYDVLTPKPLWAEQWPDVWYEATKESIRKTVEKAVNELGVAKEDIKGIAISGLYGGSGIPLDEEMKPIRPCMIWMDSARRKRRTGCFRTSARRNFLRSPTTELTHTMDIRRFCG